MIPLDSTRPPLCRLLICSGDTCGKNPDIHPETLREIWNAEGLHETVSMKTSTCQDACEHASVARIITENGTEWFQNLHEQEYQELIAWARECKRTQSLAKRPPLLAHKLFRGQIPG